MTKPMLDLRELVEKRSDAGLGIHGFCRAGVPSTPAPPRLTNSSAECWTVMWVS
jgi:hypothetical protein